MTSLSRNSASTTRSNVVEEPISNESNAVATRTHTKPQESPESKDSLGGMVEELSHCIVEAMDALYRYQGSVKDPKSKSSDARNFEKLRSELKQHWDDIMRYLQACQAFGADVELLKDALDASPEERDEILNEMAASTKTMKEKAGTMRDQSRGIQNGFFKKTANGKNSQNDAGSSNSTSQEQRGEETRPEVEQVVVKGREGAAKKAENLEKKTNDAFSRIQSKLELIHNFWKKSEEYAESKAKGATFERDEVEKIMKDWAQWRGVIQHAINTIAKATDAVPVSPPPRSSKGNLFKGIFKEERNKFKGAGRGWKEAKWGNKMNGLKEGWKEEKERMAEKKRRSISSN